MTSTSLTLVNFKTSACSADSKLLPLPRLMECSRALRLLLLPSAEDRMRVRPPIQRGAELRESYRDFPGGLVAKTLHC